MLSVHRRDGFTRAKRKREQKKTKTQCVIRENDNSRNKWEKRGFSLMTVRTFRTFYDIDNKKKCTPIKKIC